MPNWCENNLKVSVIKKNKASLAQLAKFVKDVDGGTVVNIQQAEEMRTEHLKKNFDSYRDKADVYVKHTEMSIIKFMKEVLEYNYNKTEKNFHDGQSCFSMNRILPCPEELTKVTCPVRAENGETEKEFKARTKKHRELYGCDNWYDWNCNNWGTKWDVCEPQRDVHEDWVSYDFQTAWSPICTFLASIGMDYPLLQFELHYEEPGNGFQGDYEISEGAETRNDESDYVDKQCHSCGEDCDKGEELNDDGECPDCAALNKEDDKN